MKLETKYNIGDFVWVINGNTGQIVEREIMGVRTQYFGEKQDNRYSFVKDRYNYNGGYNDYLQYEPASEYEKYFWLYEGVCYKSKEELINSL